jgi:hypothetical protein
MINDKIENNPSYSKLKKEMEGMEELGEFLKMFGLSNPKLEELFSKVPEFKEQLKKLSTTPDRFNIHFSKLGWIAHESMNPELMVQVVDIADSGKAELAEKTLINYYCSEEIKWHMIQFKFTKEFKVRHHLIQVAYADTLLRKYETAIPLLLMVIDGTVNDIDKNKGFFTDGTDLTAWDSIAAHSSGLTVLRDIFNKSRNKTNEDPIYLPYRNGILHGRDLNYANEFVAAKCWALLIAIKDWAKAIKEGKKKAPEPEPELSLVEQIGELSKSLDAYNEAKKRRENVSRIVEQWKPRNLVIGNDVPETGNPADYGDLTPEKAAIVFLDYWKNAKYGNIAQMIHTFFKMDFNLNKKAGEIRELLTDKRIIGFTLINIKDESPAISEVMINVEVLIGEKSRSKNITLRMICVDEKGDITTIGDNNSRWKVMDTFDHQIISIY